MPKKRTTYVTSPAQPTTSTSINIPERVSTPFTQQPITFSIECCDGKWCFNKIKELREKANLAARLHELSQLAWGDSKQTSRQSLGYETLDHIKVTSKKLPAGARKIGFVYHNNHRMIGYRDVQGIFHILWFDYNGKLYKHN
ncbi:MAG: hypothetical protein MUO17_00940 [Dehalococcoidales bacterium]|nr:hypothetical protein [Dehalococcoidales bacterium]